LLNLAQRGTIAQFVSVSQARAISSSHGDVEKREQEQFGYRLLILKDSYVFVHSSDSKRFVSMLEICRMNLWAVRGPNKDREMSVFCRRRTNDPKVSCKSVIKSRHCGRRDKVGKAKLQAKKYSRQNTNLGI